MPLCTYLRPNKGGLRGYGLAQGQPPALSIYITCVSAAQWNWHRLRNAKTPGSMPTKGSGGFFEAPLGCLTPRGPRATTTSRAPKGIHIQKPNISSSTQRESCRRYRAQWLLGRFPLFSITVHALRGLSVPLELSWLSARIARAYSPGTARTFFLYLLLERQSCF